MTRRAPDERGLRRGDAAALWLFALAGAVIAAWTLWASVARIADLARGEDVEVAVEFVGQAATVDMESGPLTAAIDRGTITVEELDGFGLVSGIAARVLFAATVIVVVACLVLLSRRILRGRVFGAQSTAIVMSGGLVGLIGGAGVLFFDNMLANAAMAQVSDGPFDTAVISVEPLTFVLAAFALSVIGTAFTVGAHMRKDTEGLV